MSSISLTASMRSNLLSLQGTAKLMNQTQERLSSGKKVNSAIDNPSSYYTAQSLTNRASDLSGLLDSMGQAVSTIKAANEGIESITTFVEQAKAVATAAIDTADVESRKAYAVQFEAIREQIDAMAGDSGYKGINLLKGDTLSVVFNEGRDHKLDIVGVDATTGTNGLNIAAAEADTWGGEDGADAIKAAIEATTDAINKLRDYASTFGNNYSIVQTREEFTENLINVLEEGADKLTLADMNEESANMLALQTRQQLAINSLSLASQAAQSVLKLF
jgi:flagellin-like hook-associated protein FlgL